MILIVFGSRRLRNYRLVKQKLDSILRSVDTSTIVEIRCGSSDELAARYIRDVLKLQDKIALHSDVNTILCNATHAIAFKPDYCESRGTDDMIERCKRHGINMRIVAFDKLHGGE
jgi:hypothetical protein